MNFPKEHEKGIGFNYTKKKKEKGIDPIWKEAPFRQIRKEGRNKDLGIHTPLFGKKINTTLHGSYTKMKNYKSYPHDCLFRSRSHTV